ncbi:YaiI/YqxD family protein [Thalassobaculum sp.]|uniref:YaiI/YqxD family protein n=1 Tax=Thalassobaculum sp. TaxID=2022740 RepID=UPI003B5AC414
MTDARIFVDADACPVRDEVLTVSDRLGCEVFLVSNRGFRVTDRPKVHNIVVSQDLDAADDWIVDRVAAQDVVVTGDIPLASRCLEAGARVIDHKGKPFTTANIGMALSMRELMSDLRAMGESKGGGPAFTKQDRSRFLEALDRALRG